MFRSIIVGTDGSETAALAVDRAVELGVASGAKVTIASAGSPARAKQVVEAEAGRHTEAGDFDLMVVGNKGMTGASRFLLGSVPNKISHHVPIALLIVRTT